MNRVRDAERGGLLRQAFVLIRLLHHQAPRLFSSMSGDKELSRPVDVPIAWTWARSDQTEHALNGSPVVTTDMIVGEVGVDGLSRRCLSSLGRSTLSKEIHRPHVSRNVHLQTAARGWTTTTFKARMFSPQDSVT